MIKIGCDLTRDLTIYKNPKDYFNELKNKFEVVMMDPHNLPTDDELKDIEIYFGDRITPSIVDKLPKLKWIHLTSVGYDKLIGLDREDLIITNSKNVMDNGVISTILGFMFSLSRGLHYCLKSKTINRYKFEKYFNKIQDVIGQSILIVGMGNIGDKLSKICKSLGMTVRGINRQVKNVYTLKELPNIVSEFDYVVNLLPYSKETDKIFNKSIFNRMKDTAFFINVGRGKSVVESDLIEALSNSEIGGAGLDVFEKEPLSEDSKLWDLDNVIITPHIAGYSNEYWKNQKKLFSENLNRYLNNNTMLNEIKI
ncbi:D-2-hydroxyacid dehydrogenase [Candidatus Woesearchaeota archaeon]|jgi:D-2-hydroxyacid dehydrogenase (NADP+)|nr:D-2-hydroxyacid dehydrogenase [Candidatus Woesearchaeota archaeon]